MSTALIDPAKLADDVLNASIRHAIFGSDPAVIVKSPPGAGKTFLVECACAVAVGEAGMSVLVVTPNVTQAYDVARRLLGYDLPRLAVLHAQHRGLPDDLIGNVDEHQSWSPAFNKGPGVIVANAHMLAAHLPKLQIHEFDLLIVDEGFQLGAAGFMPVSDLAERMLMVGDPGQLPPVVSVETRNLEAAQHKMHWSAPNYLCDRFPNTPVYGLPVTRRLTADTTDIIQPAFYPDLPFVSVVPDAQRRLDFPVLGMSTGIDRALDAVAGGAGIVGITLAGEPAAHQEADEELAKLIASLSHRIFQRQATWRNVRQLSEKDIGCIDPHVHSGGALSRELRAIGLPDVRVDTAERWQGLEAPIMIVRHPLSRVGKPQPFDLEVGRWCVSLSRHQLGCIVVGRECVDGTIDQYVHGCDSVAAGAKDTVWNGFTAHRHVWNTLRAKDRIFRL